MATFLLDGANTSHKEMYVIHVCKTIIPYQKSWILNKFCGNYKDKLILEMLGGTMESASQTRDKWLNTK